MRTLRNLSLAVAIGAAAVAVPGGQGRRGFTESFEHPAIQYPSGPRTDAVAELVARLERGDVTLTFDPTNGYLRSLLDALKVPVDSQVMVYSQTSLQASHIDAANPRAIFFNDSVAVGWVRGGSLEVASVDPVRGVNLFEVPQVPDQKPRFIRSNECLQCHVTWETYGVPGLVTLSTGPPDPTGYATGGYSDHRTPFAQRWGGWLVTGQPGALHHMGNVPVNQPLEQRPARTPVLATAEGRFDPKGYISMHSDIVALMALEHQAGMSNLLIWLGWQARVADAKGVGADDIRDIVRAVVDYMLFVDEAPLPGRIEGSSGFAARFAAQGPADARGRSFRQFDLERRLLKFPCSYLIYSPVFDALPAFARAAVYERMWQVLSGADPAPKYRKLALEQRQAIVEILAETRAGWPAGYKNVSR